MKTLIVNSIAAAIAISMSGVAFAGAGHDGGDHHAPAIGEQGKAEKASRTVVVTMRDNYYEPEQVSVREGETIRFKLNNQGSLVHEFNIGTPAMHQAHQKEMLTMVQHGVIQGGTLNREMMSMDMGNGKTMKQDDPNSVLLVPGESAEIIWTFSRTTELEFACNVPGHYQSGMAGTIEFNQDQQLSLDDKK